MRLSACLVAAALTCGCAAHRVPSASRTPAGTADPASLETFVEKVRKLSAAARPPRANDAHAIEKSDIELSAARLLLTATPSAANHRRVGEAYMRLGVLDAAYDHFAAAVHLSPHDASSLDALARIWRDWGLPHLGLDDATRAIAAAPESPVPQNTLGTLLLKMGRAADARAAFERALALEPSAAYALNNLCYVSLMQADARHAVETCRAALEAQPSLKAARNNLALAYAGTGDFAAASREFALGGSQATAHYNMGIALMATRHYEAAARTFDEAALLRPSSRLPRDRARQARGLAAAVPGGVQ